MLRVLMNSLDITARALLTTITLIIYGIIMIRFFFMRMTAAKPELYSGDTIHKAAIEFIEMNRDKPFFLFYPTTIPHAELVAKTNI